MYLGFKDFFLSEKHIDIFNLFVEKPAEPLPPHSSLVYGSIRPTSGVTPVFLLHPFLPCKEAVPLYWVYGSIGPTTGFPYPKS